MNRRDAKSPYLAHPQRLADVLVAIQVMGSSLWDSREIKDWQAQLGDRPQSLSGWEALFAQHPEFFGSHERDGGRMLHWLRLRRAYERTIDPESFSELLPEEIEQLKTSGAFAKARLARRALSPAQVEALMKTAIELQVRAGALEDRSRWWLPLLAAVVGFLGAVLGSLLKGS